PARSSVAWRRSSLLLSGGSELEAALLERCSQLAAGIVQGLVEGASGGGEALGEDVDGHVVERHRDQDLPLAVAEAALDLLAQGREQLGVRGAAAGRAGAVGEHRPGFLLERDLASLPGTATHLHS